MTVRVVHRERLAWDAARVFARALESGHVFRWLRAEVGRRIGHDHAVALAESRDRMWASQRSDAPQIESGIWRARIDDLLAADGSLAVPLQQLVSETRDLLARAADIRPFAPAEPVSEPGVIDLDRYRT
jgi:hypothetical protein